MSERHTEALIVNALKFTPGPLTFEDIITRIPELTWSQVFYAVEDLNRTGQVVLTGQSVRVRNPAGPQNRPIDRLVLPIDAINR